LDFFEDMHVPTSDISSYVGERVNRLGIITTLNYPVIPPYMMSLHSMLFVNKDGSGSIVRLSHCT